MITIFESTSIHRNKSLLLLYNSIMSGASLAAPPRSKQSAISNGLIAPPSTAKRKCNDVEDYSLETVLINTAKRKRSKKSKRRNSDEDYSLDIDRGLNLAIAKLDKRLSADYIAKRTKRFFPDLSLVELEDRYIPGNLPRQ